MADHKEIENIAEVLDNIATALDELKEECPLTTETYEQMKRSIERATSAIDRLADRESTSK
jgi:hypothetical protein